MEKQAEKEAKVDSTDLATSGENMGTLPSAAGSDVHLG